MSQAQQNQEQSARVRSTPPPIPRHSHIAPVTSKARSTPPPPPLAAILPRPKPSLAPRLSVPAPAHLAFVPLWDDANLPLRPAPQQINETIYWVGSTTVSLAVGALVAASLMTVRFADYNQIMPRGLTPPPAAQAELVPQPLAAAVAAVEAPVQVYEAEEALTIDLADIEEITPARQPVLIPELTVTSRAQLTKSGKLAKQVKIAPRKAPKRGKRGRTMPAAISDAQSEAQEAAPVEAEAQAVEVAVVAEQPAPETVQVEAPLEAAPEPVEPPAPTLPEKLTREQVKSGLDSVRAKVFACAHGSYGKILADVTISAPGQVVSAVIEGTFAGTNAAACMTQKINRAKVAAFSGPDISVRYPYSF